MRFQRDTKEILPYKMRAAQKVSRVERSQFHIKEKKCNFFVASVVRVFIMVARCSKCDFRNLGIIWDRNR